MAAKEEIMMNPRAGRQQNPGRAALATLPFALFGLICILASLQMALSPVYIYLAFSLIVLVGLVIGLAQGFLGWAYSYLGWSMVMAWWWMMMPMDTFSGRYISTAHNQFIGWRSWLLLLAAVGIGLLLARSFKPIRQLVHGIGEDWTLLSFMMYAFAAFALLLYDENHHPYLVAFMLGSTLVISLGAWFYLRSTDTWKKIVSLLFGFIGAYVVSYICYATWDWAAYYGFPEAPAQAWYVALRNIVVMLSFWMLILFWPAIVGLVQRGFKKRRTV